MGFRPVGRIRSTACIRNSGFSAKSNVSAFNKSQCQTESEVLFNPLLLIHANRCTQADKKNQPHVKAHLVFPTAKANTQKTKRAFTSPPPPKLTNSTSN